MKVVFADAGYFIANLFLSDYTQVPSVNGSMASGISAAEETIALLSSMPA